MSAHLPHLPLRSGRRVLLYQPSCQSCTSTVLESCAPTELDAISSDEEVASSTVAVASSSSASSQLVGASGSRGVLPPSGHQEVGAFSHSLDVLSSSASSQFWLAEAFGRVGVFPPSGHQEDHQQLDRDRSRSPARLPILPVEEGVGESGRADDYLEVPEEVEGVGESGHAGYLEVPDQAAVGTQLMNGSASNIDVDVRGGEPRPLGVEAFGRVGVGTSQTVPGPQWMSASAAEATDAGSSAAGFLLARAFRDILALGSLDTESHQRGLHT